MPVAEIIGDRLLSPKGHLNGEFGRSFGWPSFGKGMYWACLINMSNSGNLYGYAVRKLRGAMGRYCAYLLHLKKSDDRRTLASQPPLRKANHM